MMQANFVYPEYGYVFLPDETSKLTLEITSDKQGTVSIKGSTVDYNEVFVEDILVEGVLEAGVPQVFDIPVKCPKLGYFRADLEVTSGDETVKKVTGFGLTTPHERVCVEDSYFGISCNYDGEQKVSWPLFARMGMRYLRTWNVRDTKYLLEKYGLYASEQSAGNDMHSHFEHPNRYAKWCDNRAYYYEKDYGNLCKIMEHGNEFWEEHNLTLLAEWHKSSGLARHHANPLAWYTNSGAPGCDVKKFEILDDQGMFDYINALCIHAYSFPGAPEGLDSYWSLERLRDVANFMKERNINMPVCCTEQGYPAMYDQTKCESYSPGEMSTLDGQADYLVRSWLMFLSMGVTKVVYFNGPWYDGFGVLEKEGPAPWPAAMALCELVRALDYADYVGDYKAGEGIYYKIFRDRRTKQLIGTLWRPVYYSRSFMKEKNLSLDGKYYESEGKAQEIFDYKLHDLGPDWYVKDLMGNKIEVENETVKIGERPIYIYNISESIIDKLTDETIFPVKKVVERPMPCEIILGLTDSWPAKDWYLTSRFMPGMSREYTLRVHNFSDELLEDTVIIEVPEGFTSNVSEIDVSVIDGITKTYKFWVTCSSTAKIGDDYKVRARFKKCPAHPVYQIAAVYCPIYFKPLNKPLEAGDTLKLTASTPLTNKKFTFEFISRNEGMEFEESKFEVVLDKSAPTEIPIKITKCPALYEPVIDVKVSDENGSVVYETAIQTDYIEYSSKVDPDSLSEKQMSIISGYNMIMTAGVDYKGPELFGTAKPEPLSSYMRVEADDEKYYFHFDIKDPRVVCAKNTRRNNIDSDGVWIRFFKSFDDKDALRHFCITPVDQAGNPKGCAVDEVSSNILFATPYTDYDFSKISVKADVYDEGYTLDIAICKDSIGYETVPDAPIIDIRVINMNDDDWSKFYDTGKREYALLK